MKEQIVDDVEVLKEDSISEYLSSSSESEDVDSETGAEEEIEDNSDVDTNNTPAQEKTPMPWKILFLHIIIMQIILRVNKM